MKERAPSHIQGIFDRRLHGQELVLKRLAAFIAALTDLILEFASLLRALLVFPAEAWVAHQRPWSGKQHVRIFCGNYRHYEGAGIFPHPGDLRATFARARTRVEAFRSLPRRIDRPHLQRDG